MFSFVLRAGIKRPELASQSPVLEFSNKKPRKFYAVSSEKWYMGSKISQEDFDASEAAFLAIVEAGEDIEKILACLEDARVFVQIQFRSEDPSAHITKNRIFWKMPYGPKLLSNHFEWLVDGSRDGDLAFSIEDHIDMVLNMTAQILGDKKGKDWINQLEEVQNNSRTRNGNEIMSRVFIIRELAKSWKNNPAKLIFVEGEDSMSNVSSQPYVNILRVDQTGEGDYDEAIVVSVRVGTTTIFDGVSLTQGLAAVIQLCFVFHLLYPSDTDEIFNFVQRLLAKFGPSDGAKNIKGQLKKRFVDFQCALSDILLLQKSGTVRKLFVA